jgi:hypothetical protein
MSVPAGTPIKVALNSEVRIKGPGQAIRGKTTDPVFVFDKLLIPAGTAVNGKIAAIDGVPNKIRTLSAMDANFSPARNVRVQFDELVLPDGRRVAMNTVVSPAPNGVVQFVSPSQKENQKDNKPGKAGETPAPAEQQKKKGETASREVSEAGQQIKNQLTKVKKQIQAMGNPHTLKRMVLAQLPVHPQYLDAGTSFNADLVQPLDFGAEAVKPEELTGIGAPPPSGSVVHARLITALNSSTTKKGELVEAMMTEPLVVSDRLILPEGSMIKGSVVQVRPARRLGHNGELRIRFHQVAPPDGIEQKVEASLEGVAVAKDQHLKLDAEGGARVTAPRTRYLTTGVQLAVAGVLHDDDLKDGTVSGGSGFRFIGMAVGALARSRIVSTGLGAYGAATSVYYHFLARGRDVVYPKDMTMVIGLGTREAGSKAPASPAASAPASPAEETTPAQQKVASR